MKKKKELRKEMTMIEAIVRTSLSLIVLIAYVIVGLNFEPLRVMLLEDGPVSVISLIVVVAIVGIILYPMIHRLINEDELIIK